MPGVLLPFYLIFLILKH